MTLLDACPVLGTMGTLLKSWLTKNLLSNLEKKSTCKEPRKQVGKWLADAGFTGTESGKRLTFRGVEGEIKPGKKGDDATGDVQRLNVVVGRMLWKELWGPFVEGHKWWWDDAAIREECSKLGTKWECVVVEAVKRS